MTRNDHPAERCLIGIDLDGKVHRIALGRPGAIRDFIGNIFTVHTAVGGPLSMAIYLDDEGMLSSDNRLNLAATLVAGFPIYQPVVIASGRPSPAGDDRPCDKPTRDFIVGMASMAEAILANADGMGQDLRVHPNPDTVPPPRIYAVSDGGELTEVGAVRSAEDLIGAMQRGEKVPIDEIGEALERRGFPPMPATKEEALAELIETTGLDLETLKQITGLPLGEP